MCLPLGSLKFSVRTTKLMLSKTESGQTPSKLYQTLLKAKDVSEEDNRSEEILTTKMDYFGVNKTEST